MCKSEISYDKKKINFDESLERLLKNYFNFRKSWESWCYLSNLEVKYSTEDIRKYADDNDLLFHLRYVVMKDYHIEYYKMFKVSYNKDNNRDNIFRLLSFYLELNPIKEKAVSLVLKKLHSCSEVIKRALDVRDKFYAHLDYDYKSYNGTFKFHDFEDSLVALEGAIILLVSKKKFKQVLSEIPSRNDFKLHLTF